MKLIHKYLSTKIKQSKIEASNNTLLKIIEGEIKRLGNDADLNHIDVSKVTDGSCLFWSLNDCRDFCGDVSKWNVSKIERFDSMFQDCRNFNCDISDWDVSSGKTMAWMFSNCKKFDQDLSKWDVSGVINFISMFEFCDSFNHDLSNWDLSEKKKSNTTQMFYSCPIKIEFKPKLPSNFPKK